MDEQVDVIVIGGGPAGSTSAAYLSMKGLSVTLLEKAVFPRDHVGESLLPFCYQVFEELGVLEAMKKRFVRKPGVRFIDVDGTETTTWCFGHVLKGPDALSFHVRRAEFDNMLLENAARLGATVHQNTRVTSVDLEGEDGGVVVTAVTGDGEERTLKARFLVDASGRDTFLGRKLRCKKPHKNLDRAALSTHWKGAKFAGGIEEGLLQIVYLGGEKKGWIWVIPVTNDRLSIGLVLNHAYIRDQKAKLQAAGEENWQEALYRQELNASSFVRDLTENAEFAQDLAFNGNYSYACETKYGSNFAVVGDASAFIDPILASGVYISLNSARLVAPAIHTALTEGAERGAEAISAAYGQILGAYSLVDRAIALFYNPISINFAQAGPAAGLLHEQHRDALATGHYLLAGDFFENHEKYLGFIDLLENPKTYEKFQHFVVKKREYQGTSCGFPRAEIFAELMGDDSEAAE